MKRALFNFHQSWHEYVEPLFKLGSMQDLKNTILKKSKFFPEPINIFRVFNMKLQDVKIVFLSKEPYSTPAKSNGLAFAVNEGVKKTKTLEIIENELKRYIGIWYKIDPTLDNWSKQGILLLNSSLTVEQNSKNTHLKYWKEFTSRILTIVASNNTGVIFVTFGNEAKDVLIKASKLYPHIKKVSHHIHSVHPDAENYGKNKFLGNDVFKKIDDICFNINGEKIIW